MKHRLQIRLSLRRTTSRTIRDRRYANGRIPPSTLGIATRRTRLRNTLPEDSRFQSLKRLFERSASKSATPIYPSRSPPSHAATSLFEIENGASPSSSSFQLAFGR